MSLKPLTPPRHFLCIPSSSQLWTLEYSILSLILREVCLNTSTTSDHHPTPGSPESQPPLPTPQGGVLFSLHPDHQSARKQESDSHKRYVGRGCNHALGKPQAGTQMPSPEDRAGSVCIWVVLCLFFVLLSAGGALLVLYIALPESESAAWFPIAGMVLVGFPWLFWIITCMYRSITMQRTGVSDRTLPVRAATVVPASTPNATFSNAGADDEPLDSPNGTRRVRFGVATVVGSEDGEGGAAGGKAKEQEAEGGSHVTSASIDDGSSLASHESERPLAYSMPRS